MKNKQTKKIVWNDESLEGKKGEGLNGLTYQENNTEKD